MQHSLAGHDADYTADSFVFFPDTNWYLTLYIKHVNTPAQIHVSHDDERA